MAPEAIKDKKYSEKSDAWSFGVLLWEVRNTLARLLWSLSEVNSPSDADGKGAMGRL